MSADAPRTARGPADAARAAAGAPPEPHDDAGFVRVVSQAPPPDTAEARALITHPNARTHIRSFALRTGKITPAQNAAHAALLPRWGVPYRAAPLDARAVFGRDAPLVLEIGCGMGETTARIAQARPESDFLGVEVFTAGVGALLRRIEDASLTNLRVIQHDAVEVVRDMIPRDTLAAVHVFFPDPWHKARHHKRRLIQAPFVALLASRLRPGGILHCATDWAPYALQMLDVLGREPLLANTAGPVRVADLPEASAGFAPRPAYRLPTKFEQRGVRLGHGVWDLVFMRASMQAAPRR